MEIWSAICQRIGPLLLLEVVCLAAACSDEFRLMREDAESLLFSKQVSHPEIS